MSNYAVILAAGKGTRMKSQKHKVLHPVCGKPMIDHVLDRLAEIGVQETIVVVGHLKEKIEAHVGERSQFVHQKEQLGTAHAVMQTRSHLADKTGSTLILNGDHPLFTQETLAQLLLAHEESGAAATLLTAHLTDATGYGRILRNVDGEVEGIIEHKDATDEQRRITEVNTGTYLFDNQKLFAALNDVTNDNAQGEYYLPDVFGILKAQGERIQAVSVEDNREAMGINDRYQLAEAESIMRERINTHHMLNGVSIQDPAYTYIDADVTIGQDTVVAPGTFLRGQTQIGTNCFIGPNADLHNVHVGDDVSIRDSVLQESTLADSVSVGPYAYIRPHSQLKENVKIGCFVDLKNAAMGQGSKISHLAYVGDAEVGEDVNIGCGVVTVNYDGKNKHKTHIEDGAFIGCNANLVAPVRVQKGAYVAAGSTITKDVPENALAIARERQVLKLDYVSKLKARFSKS